MCNFYMMYYTDRKGVSSLECWGYQELVQVPSSAADFAPYPGYAGKGREEVFFAKINSVGYYILFKRNFPE